MADASRRNHSSASPFEPVYGYSRAVRVGNRIDVAGCAPIEADGSSTPGDAGRWAQKEELSLTGSSNVLIRDADGERFRYRRCTRAGG